MNPQDAQEIRRILRKKLIPLRDQREILEDIQTLETIMNRISRDDDPRAKTSMEEALFGMEDLADRSSRYLMAPDVRSTPLREALQEIRSNAEELYQEFSQPRKEKNSKRIIINNASKNSKAIKTLGIKTNDFKYIPYSFSESPEGIEEAISKIGLRASREKTYKLIPIKERANSEWNLELIKAPTAWQITRGAGTTVGVVDTGCDYTHHEISNRFTSVLGYNFVTNTDDPMDDHYHGTHVAGSVAGATVGVAPESTLYALKFLDSGGWGREVDFIRSAEWCIDQGVNVVNGSFGSQNSSVAEQAICDEMLSRGLIFVAAAGNDGIWDYNYPASYNSVIAVAAVDSNKQRASFSQMNDTIELSAPGVGIYSCIPGGYDILNGTSMATPHVAGSAALLRSMYQDHYYVRDVMMQSAEELGDKDEYGYGLVRPDKALNMAEVFKRYAA